MKIEINAINVEDGDAIIVMLTDKDRKSLIVIDGGYKKYYIKVKKRIIELLPLFDNKIDLLICTHYDNDHIGGVEKILDDFHTKIQEIWIHKIENSLDATIELIDNKINILKNNLILEEYKFVKSIDALNNNLIIEGYQDLLRVIQKIKKYGLEDKIVQAIRGTRFNKFPELEVVSPTREYYNENLPALKEESILEDLKSNIKNKSTKIPSSLELLHEKFEKTNTPHDACKALEISSIENSVTATNMVSIVSLITINDKKFLFTGDAGIETFEQNTPNWDRQLGELFFMTLPHHGSKNNTSKNMLDVFQTQNIFVSGKGSVNRPSILIENCVKSRLNLKVFEVTNSIKETWYLKIDEDGKFERILNN